MQLDLALGVPPAAAPLRALDLVRARVRVRLGVRGRLRGRGGVSYPYP